MTTPIASPPKIAKDGRLMSPASLANLKPPYKPGENGHQGGFPLKEALFHILKKDYSKLTEADKAKLKVGDVLVLETIKGAIALNPTAFNQVWDRVEGKVPEKHAVLGDIVVKVVYEERKKIANGAE